MRLGIVVSLLIGALVACGGSPAGDFMKEALDLQEEMVEVYEGVDGQSDVKQALEELEKLSDQLEKLAKKSEKLKDVSKEEAREALDSLKDRIGELTGRTVTAMIGIQANADIKDESKEALQRAAITPAQMDAFRKIVRKFE